MTIGLAINSGSRIYMKALINAKIRLFLPLNVTNLSKNGIKIPSVFNSVWPFKNSITIWWFVRLCQMHERNCRLEILDM